MTLQLDVHAGAAEDADQAIEQTANTVPPAGEHGAAGDRDEAGGAAVELLERERALAFRRAHFHARDQFAEIPIAFGRFAQHRKHKGLDRQEGLDGRDRSYLWLFVSCTSCPSRLSCP